MVRTGGLALRWFKDNIARKADDDAYYGEMDDGHPADAYQYVHPI